MNQILFGSQAIKHWFPDFRKCHDSDFICQELADKHKIVNGQKIEYYYSPAFDWLLKNEKEIASPNALYTIKVSHSFWDVHWEKTMHDIEFLQNKNCKIIEEFYNLLIKDWEIRHGKKKVKLNVSNEQFFNSYVDRKFPHDQIHRSIMFYDEPMYDKLKRDKSKAWIEKDLFDQLSLEEQLNACREETYVIALERFLIPEDLKVSYRLAYHRSAKALITRLSKGWFPRFMVEHWRELKIPENYNWIDKFKTYFNYEKTN